MTQEQITAAIQALQQVAARLEENIKTIFKRIDEQARLAESVHQMVTELKYMRIEQEQMRKDVDEIKAGPARRWDEMVRTIITVAVSGAVGYLLSRITGGV